jgi:hypothetical protein
MYNTLDAKQRENLHAKLLMTVAAIEEEVDSRKQFTSLEKFGQRNSEI